MEAFGQAFDFSMELPEGLVLAKPLEQGSFPVELFTNTDLIATRKWNGWRLIITITPANNSDVVIRMYTEGKQLRVDSHLPHIVQDLHRLNIPPWTVLVGEIIVEREGIERLGAVGGILRMKDPREAVRKQEREGHARLILHGSLCWNGIWLTDTHYPQILQILEARIPSQRIEGFAHTLTAETGTLDEAQDYVRTQNCEGLVIYDPTYRFTWRLDGPAPSPRPDGAYKWKPQEDGDFTTTAPRMSQKRPGRIKDVMLQQRDPDGRLFNCGRFGGFTKEEDAELREKKGQVILEIRYDGRTPAGKIVGPRLLRFRDDKLPEQCVSPCFYKEAEYVS